MTEIIDMSKFVEAKSDQLNADDLIGGPRTIKITRVQGCSGDQPIAISYDGDNGKPFKPCKTIRRILIAAWGKYANEYVGRSMTVYRDNDVKFGGLMVGGIRISHMSHIEKAIIVVVMKTKGKKAPIEILPLIVETERDKKAEWAAKFIAHCAACETLEKLNELHAKQFKWAEEIKDDRPELYQQCDDAFKGRLEALSVVSRQEGRTDEQHGDQFDGDDTAA